MKEEVLNLQPGSYRADKSRMIHRGQDIALDSLELELTGLESGEMAVYATARTMAKVLGLNPEERDIRVIFEWKGDIYEIEQAMVFDLDIHVSGETTVQITGRLQPLPEEVWPEA